MLLAHLPIEKIREAAADDGGKLFERIKEQKNDRAFIVLFKVLEITSLANLPNGVADSFREGSAELTPGMRQHLASFLPPLNSTKITYRLLRDISTYGDSEALRKALEAFIRPIRKLEARYAAELKEYADAPDDLAQMKRYCARDVDRTKAETFNLLLEGGILLHAIRAGDKATCQMMMSVAPKRKDSYDRLSRWELDDVLLEANKAGSNGIRQVIVDGLPAKVRQGYGFTTGNEARKTVVSLKAVDGLLRAARESEDADVLAQTAEDAWGAYQREGAKMGQSRARELFVASHTYDVRAAIYMAQRDALAQCVGEGDFTVLERIEDLNRDAVEKKLEAMGVSVALQHLDVLKSDGAHHGLATFGVDSAQLVGATLVLKQSLEKIAAEQAARELLGISLGATI